MSCAKVIIPGALTTVQDFGRQGYARLGYPECGAADRWSMQLANTLAGNGPDSRDAVLECNLLGPTLRFDAFAVVAITGAAFAPKLDDVPVPMFAPVAVRPGQTLTVGAASSGLRGYIAVAGGWDVPLVMGSRATDLKCGIGGIEGRFLHKDDSLPYNAAAPERAEALQAVLCDITWAHTPLHAWRVSRDHRWPVLRCVLGPQDDAFTAAGQTTFERGVYKLSADSNRMACKLSGPAVESVQGSDILSDGIVTGSVQIASDGRPIVMLADHQTTGGYAKIATVIPTDVDVLAQLRPGEEVSFRFVSPAEAVDIARGAAKRLAWIGEQYNVQ